MKNKHLMFVMFSLILILSFASISAYNFDNVKNYDKYTKTLTIDNAFGLGDTISTIRLDSDMVQKVGMGYQKVAEFTINTKDEDYKGKFDKMDLYDVNDNMNSINRDLDYKYKVVETIKIDKYKEVCNKDNSSCVNIEDGYVSRDIVEWIDVSEGLPKGEITIGIFTNVQKGDMVEWIPEIQGVRIDEWAIWTEDLNTDLKSYYKLNETTGVVLDATGTYNGTNVGAIRGANGIIGKSFNFTGTSSYSNVNNVILNYTTSTFNFWINTNTTIRGTMLGNDQAGKNDDVNFELDGYWDDWSDHRDGFRDINGKDNKERDKAKFPYKRGGKNRCKKY